MINIRQLSVRCGHCGTYQTLCHFQRGEEWNVYTYECDNERCDPGITRTLLEVPVELDAFARRDPEWGGGRRHAGAAGGEEKADPDADPPDLVQLGSPPGAAAEADSEGD